MFLRVCIYLFKNSIHSSSKHFLNTYCVSSTFLGIEDMSGDATKCLPSSGLRSREGSQHACERRSAGRVGSRRGRVGQAEPG